MLFRYAEYGNQRVYEMVMQVYKYMRNSYYMQTVSYIHSHLPRPMLDKYSYVLAFDAIKQDLEGKMKDVQKLNTTRDTYAEFVENIPIKRFGDIRFGNWEGYDRRVKEYLDKIIRNPPPGTGSRKPIEVLKEMAYVAVKKYFTYNVYAALRCEKLNSGLPIFKAIIYLRYQFGCAEGLVFGEEKPFATDKSFVNISDVPLGSKNLKLFIEEYIPIESINIRFSNTNTVFLLNGIPSIEDIDKRATIMAKLYLLKIYRYQQNKLKLYLKNNENYISFYKLSKKVKVEYNQDKQKETEYVSEEYLTEYVSEEYLMNQVTKTLVMLEEKANLYYYTYFQKNKSKGSTKAKKGFERIKYLVDTEADAKSKLKLLITYVQKHGW